MVVLGLIARDAANCPICTAAAATAVPNVSMEGSMVAASQTSTTLFNVVAPLTIVP
jgi:hypothetical protein